MSVDSKVFVCCEENKALEVGQAVLSGLKNWYRNKCSKTEGFTDMLRFNLSNKDKYQPPHVFTTDFDVICFNFTVNEEARSLKMFPTCSCDYVYVYSGEKIIFSIGAWGSNEEIMQVVIGALKPFGDVYYNFNDCDDQGFVKV